MITICKNSLISEIIRFSKIFSFIIFKITFKSGKPSFKYLQKYDKVKMINNLTKIDVFFNEEILFKLREKNE